MININLRLIIVKIKNEELKKIEENIIHKIYDDFNFGIYSIKDILLDIKSKVNKRLEYEKSEATL